MAQWIQRHITKSAKEYCDVIVPNFVTYMPNEASSNYIIYKLIIKIREIFNIRRKLDLSEEKLRMNFYYWLDLASRKIKKLKYFDGDLIIVIEGVNFITDSDRNLETSLKFWLPKLLPERVRLIISLSDSSYNIEYLRKINCRFLELRSNNEIIRTLYSSFESRKFVLVG